MSKTINFYTAENGNICTINSVMHTEKDVRELKEILSELYNDDVVAIAC